MKKRALLIGINLYRNANAHLRGCVNDIRHVRQLLEGQYGFEAADIVTLLDGDATNTAIITAFSEMIKYLMEGDRVLFWYSGHGTQKYTPSASEPDQLTECIVPWETTVESLIEDKWFGGKLNEVVLRGFGASITLVFDCCHSGTITRKIAFDNVLADNDVVRNRFLPYSLLTHVAPASASAMASKARALKARGFRAADKKGIRSIANSPWDVLSACQDEQEAADTFLDGEFRGAFSYSLIRALKDEPNTDFAKLESRVKGELRELLPKHCQEPAFAVRSDTGKFFEIPSTDGRRSIPLSTLFGLPRGNRITREFVARAGSNDFGPWESLGQHRGLRDLSIALDSVANAGIVGQVKYWDRSRTEVIKEFQKTIDISTGNVSASVALRLKGRTGGAEVRGQVSL